MDSASFAFITIQTRGVPFREESALPAWQGAVGSAGTVWIVGISLTHPSVANCVLADLRRCVAAGEIGHGDPDDFARLGGGRQCLWVVGLSYLSTGRLFHLILGPVYSREFNRCVAMNAARGVRMQPGGEKGTRTRVACGPKP